MFYSLFVSYSLGHALDHLGLDCAVSVILAIEVLRFVTHAMASVANDRDLHFRVVWHLCLLTCLVRGHCDLEAGRHGLEFIRSSHVTVLQARSHRVNIEERVFAVLDVRRRLAVQSLVALVANRWQI